MDEDFKNLIKKFNINFSRMDLTNLDIFSRLDSDYNQIYHLAAIVGVKKVSQNPFLTLKVNTLSTLYILDFIKEIKNRPKILFASSCENYAGSIKNCKIVIPTPEEIPLCIEDVYNPRWTYASSKILGELACLHCSKKYNFNTTIVRYHNIYGPRMGFQRVISEFIIRLKKDPSKLEMYGGYQYRSFCYVDDAVKMTINLMNNHNANNKIVNIGNEHYIKISLLAKKLFKIMEITPEIIEKGAPEGSVEKRRPDLKLIKKLGDYVSNVSFDDGLRKTYKWYDKVY
jgi:nucleoside-diphosphate-sugar epimerase